MKRLLFFLVTIAVVYAEKESELPIVVVICSFNNARWYRSNLDSVFFQDYSNYRVIYTDDASSDGNAKLVTAYVEENNVHDKITLIKNKKRHYQLYNIWRAVHTCKDHEIIIILDGDDFFAHNKVMKYINHVYQDPTVWITYGQHQEYPSYKKGICREYPTAVIMNKSYRTYHWIASHPRTFYAGLFKRIQKEDLQLQGEFFKAGADMATMFPMLEMADGRHRFIEDVLYLYNRDRVASLYRHQSLTRHTLQKRPVYETVAELW